MDNNKTPSNAYLYWRTPNANWKKGLHRKAIKNPSAFLTKMLVDGRVRTATLIHGENTYAVLSVELHDDPKDGTFDAEFIMEFDNKEFALSWLHVTGLHNLHVEDFTI